jgi:hypothetical protein
VDNVKVSSLIVINARSIVLEESRNCNTTSNRPSLVDFLNHCIFSMHVCILIKGICVIFIRNEAWFVRGTVFASIDGRAYLAVVMSSGSVDRASLISNI